jgi:hypothetical protein
VIGARQDRDRCGVHVERAEGTPTGAWLTRVQSGASLWMDLASKLMEEPMEVIRENNVIAMLQPKDWAKLIRKLRWIGMEDEASYLQAAVRTLPPEQRGTVSAGPFSTD